MCSLCCCCLMFLYKPCSVLRVIASFVLSPYCLSDFSCLTLFHFVCFISPLISSSSVFILHPYQNNTNLVLVPFLSCSSFTLSSVGLSLPILYTAPSCSLSSTSPSCCYLSLPFLCCFLSCFLRSV